MQFPADCLLRLQSAGLVVEGRFEDTGRKSADFEIIKPREVAGNSLPGYSSNSLEGITTDVPPLRVRSHNGQWILNTISQWVPGPGPEDFIHSHTNPDAVVDDAIQYLFGHSEFIEAARPIYEELRKRLEK